MDPPPANSAESRERAVSSEPCSTRPNPFDDAEVSSRKRRRTSLSGASRSRSVDSVTSSLSDVPTSTDGLSSETDPTTMKDGKDSAAPQTPERKPTTSHPSHPTPRSSRVTINVRTPSRPLETIPSSPPVLEQDQEQGPAADVPLEDDVKVSVEETEVDMITSDALESSGSETSSPPVEVITIDNDDEPEYETAQPQLTFLHGAQDPTNEFPFREATESLPETVTRLTNFILTHEGVAKGIAEWIQTYIVFARAVDSHTVWQSYQAHRDFWRTIPDLVTYMLGRREKAAYPRNPAFRREIFSFYGAFAMLTTIFIELDIKTHRYTVNVPQPQTIDLASPGYLRALAGLSQKTDIKWHETLAQNADPEWSYAEEIMEMFLFFQTFPSNQGGTMAYLEKLARMHIDLIDRFPKLCENLSYISSLMASIAAYGLQLTTMDVTRFAVTELELCKGTIARGYQYFDTMSSTLSTIIDKHINYLNQEFAGHLIVALADIYQTCLQVDRIVPAYVILEHRKTHPSLPDHDVPEAMAYHWRFTVYSKLIMSSQMQLRVMAANHMSNELVAFWRQYSNAPHGSKRQLLDYLSSFLLRTGLVAYILGPTCHPEITVESSNIVGFLLVSETYTDAHTDLLWQTMTSTQDPRVTDALIRMTNRITNLYPYDALIYLCQRFNSLAVDAWGPNIRDCCSQIFSILMQKAQDRGSFLDISPYLLCLRLARQSSVYGTRSPAAYPELRDFSIKELKNLLTCGPGPDGRRRLFQECLQDIGSKSQTSVGALAVLTTLCQMRNAQREMMLLAAEHELVRLLVDEFEAAIAAARSAGFLLVLSGPDNYYRREMITNVTYWSDGSSIPKDLGYKLWNLLVGSGAACREDRDAGWDILNSRSGRLQNGNAPTNRFLIDCFNEYLPTLPSEYFCTGTLEFFRSNFLPRVNVANSIILDEDMGNDEAGIEQLWRLILSAPPATIGAQAIHTLVSDIYVESRSITSFPPHRARKVHVAVADRCLRQLSSSALKLREFGDGTASGDEESMVIVASEEQVQEQELLFIRSLAVLRELHRLHQAKTRFTVPDLSSLILDSPADVEGDLAELKYQAFDGDTETDVETLRIGKQNTVGSLLASLREATGFSNYRLYFRGQQFQPQESDVSRTLEAQQIQDGLLLVKRVSDAPASPAPLRLGASPLENEILAHFDELQAFLSLEEKLAKEVYAFLVRLPPDENILRAIKSVDVPYTELFPTGEPFRSLYAVYALRKFLYAHRQQEDSEIGDVSEGLLGALRRGLSLVVAAITDADVLGHCSSSELRIELGSVLLQCLIDIVQGRTLPMETPELLDAHLLDRILAICLSVSPKSDLLSHTSHLCLCLQAIFECCPMSVAFWSAFKHLDGVLSLVEASLLHDTRPSVRQHVAKLICQSITDKDGLGMVQPGKFADFFWRFLYRLIDPAFECNPGAVELLNTCHTILKELIATHSEVLQPAELFSFLSKRLLAYTTFEDMTQPDIVDGVARGLIRLMHCIVTSTGTRINQPTFARLVFWKHLFPAPDSDLELSDDELEATVNVVNVRRPILCTDTRRMLIEIIFKLVDGSQEQVEWLLRDLNKLVPSTDDDGYAYDLPPQFDRSKAVRASCGYPGLRNLSNTCYLNSLVTQLFMNPSFRKFMLAARVRDRQTQGLLFETQKLFAFMQESHQRFVDPENCVANIKTYEEGPIDIHNQMDVDEFYNLLFDRWESQLQTADAKKEFRAFYGGQLVQQVRSKECDHISERLEPFSAIQCDIKGKAGLEESLQAYVDGEIMAGDNKYKCSTCDRHVDAVKRACLKDIPDNLIFHLKRFDFNLRSMQRSKINDHFAFPKQIDMRPYTIDYLSNPAEDIGEDLFELVGVLVHSGTAESGHYYSYVRERPRNKDSEAWVEFNDDTVTSWDPAQMESACYGGLDYRTTYDGNYYEKSYSAYMLFYQRASSLKADQALVQRGNLTPLRASIPQEMNDFIQRENLWLLRRHCLYDPRQIWFVITALDHMDRIKAGDPESLGDMEELAVEMGIGHLDQVASRTKDIPDFESLRKRMEQLMEDSPWCSLRIYEYFDQHRHSFRALIQRNPEPVVRSASSRLVIQAVRRIKELFPDRYSEDCDLEDEDTDNDMVLQGMMRLIKLLLDFFHVSIRAWHEVFGFMLDYVRTGPEELATFLKHPFFRTLLQIISADSSLDLSPQLARMVTTISRRLPNRPPVYENIIELISVVFSVLSNRTYGAGSLVVVDHPEHRFDNVSMRGPFPLWRGEYKILVQDWDGRNSPNIFLDKLISIDQNPAATHSIVAKYMRLSRVLEDKVWQTLMGAITGAANTPPTLHYNQPFLRVAARVYCRHARNTGNIHTLIEHVNSACASLENGETLAFFDFHREVFDGERINSGESQEDVLVQGYRNIASWAPFLLGCYDQSVGRVIEAFLQKQLFEPQSSDSEEGKSTRLGQARLKSIRALGCRCLTYIQDQYVLPRINAQTQLVHRFERVITECRAFFRSDQESEDRYTADFYRLLRNNLGQFKGLAVDDMEEDGSGMFYSDSSSVTSSVTAG